MMEIEGLKMKTVAAASRIPLFPSLLLLLIDCKATDNSAGYSRSIYIAVVHTGIRVNSLYLGYNMNNMDT